MRRFSPASLSRIVGPILLGAIVWGNIAQSSPESSPQRVSQFLMAHRHQLGTSAQLRGQLDTLCNQRDCDASELYWYRDWGAAQAAAKASNKPILSLRLLGNLDEDLSCANSRFFRVALYPNGSLRRYLADRYILHWQSVRPVPKVTVDFGNGRRLERTVTGNSIHYITTPEGHPLDGLPGLYGPAAFLDHLKQADRLFRTYQASAVPDRLQLLQQYHRDRLITLQKQWSEDLRAVGVSPSLLPQTGPAPATAIEAGRLALTKARPESSLVLGLRSVVDHGQTLTQLTDRDTWIKLGRRYAVAARLDRNSRQLIERKLGPSATSAQINTTLSAFESSLAIDGIRNEYLLHSQIHRWFAEGIPQIASLDRLNTRVYDQLFLTPDQDPWLGLVGPEAFSAIEGDGIR